MAKAGGKGITGTGVRLVRNNHKNYFKSNYMNYDQFKKLNMDQQQEVVLNDGVFLMDMDTDAFTISLYQTDHFYAEIFLFKDSSQVVWVNSFQDTAKLSRYLERIDVSELTSSLY
jgi:hypothetical protein